MFRLRLDPRPAPSLAMRLAAPLLAAILTLAAGAIMFHALGLDAGATLKVMFVQPLTSGAGWSELALKASPLILIALGLAVGFRANVWNIGADGMFIVGAIAACALALRFGDGGHAWLLPAMMLAGALGGMLWAAIPAFLRTRFNANEILVTLMLNYVATLILAYLVRGPWRDPGGFNYPETAVYDASAMFPALFDGLRLNGSVFITAAAVAGAWFFLERSFMGYKMTVAGAAPDAARYAGFGQRRMVWLSLLIGGAAAGLAGMAEASGPLGQLSPNISPGYGFAAIIVAFIGRLNAIGIVFAGLLLSLLYIGGEAAQISLQLPAALTRTFQGMLLFFLLAADALVVFQVRLIRR
jgi:ABC-type uncharacterized transport system permease subunit